MKNLWLVCVAAALAVFTLSSCETVDPDMPGALVPLTVDEDGTLPSISVNGTRLHAETFGNPDDPMIVVLHGGPGGDYRGMLKLSKFAADGYFVVFYDQRGSGLSRRYSKETYSSMEVFTDELGAVINHYRRSPDQKVILMGHSWGAMLATAYVNEHPGDVRGVVLMEPGGLTWRDTQEYIKRCQALEVFDETSNDYVYIDQILTGSDHNILDYKAALRTAANFSRGNKLGDTSPTPFWRHGAVCNAAALEYARKHPFDFTTNLQQYTTKVLFAYSELNVAYGEAYARQVASAYPNVQLAEITGTGHELQYFGWDRLYPIVTAYLNTLN